MTTIANNPLCRVSGAIAIGCVLVFPAAAHAQIWPSAPIKVIVNFPPGGAADAMARALAPTLSEALRQPIVVENKGGAGGNIGAEAVARSANDGHTLLMSSGSPISINPLIYTRMPFDADRDLIPVAAVARVLVYLMIYPSVPAKNVQEFVAHLKVNPGRLSYGSPGAGSSPHLAGELFKQRAGVEATHVPYRGGGPALIDLLGGQIQFMFDPGLGLQHARDRKLRLLAVGSLNRAPQAPDTPTLAESGMPGFDADTFFGFYAPAGTSSAIVSRFHGEVAKAMRTPRVLEIIDSIGAQPAVMTREEFAGRMKQDREAFAPLIKRIALKVE